MNTVIPTLYHSPQTRSTGARALLEELGVPYELKVLNMKTGEQRQPTYLKINPLGKVPALRHGDTLITEQVAIFLYLADRFPQAGLAPALDDPWRGTYLRWMVYYASCFEPAVVDRALQREAAPQSTSPYGDFYTMLNVLCDALQPGPWLLGERFSAADVLWGVALNWTTSFGLVPKTSTIASYIGRVMARPALQRINAGEAALLQQHQISPAQKAGA